MAELNPRISLDEATDKVWSDEDVSNREDTEEDAEDDTDGSTTPLFQRGGIGSLDDHEQGKNGTGECKVERDGKHAFVKEF